MKTRILLLILVTGIFSGATGQNTIDLTFTAVDSAAYVQLDSIKVMNRTQGGDTVLYWPDTALSLYYVGIHENPYGESAFQVFQNYPNPVADRTTVSMYVPEKDKVSIMVTDIMGRFVVKSERVLDKGRHSFRFTPGNGKLYFFTAAWQGQLSSIKILQSGSNAGATPAIEYTGSEGHFPQLKAMNDIQDFSFTPGDELLYIGYSDTLQSGILNNPEESTTYTFQFATNIPCPGTPTVEYEGQVYNTIQIFSQCWLKENLNVGTRINGSQEQTDNGSIVKYCYDDNEANCDEYGGLYQWNEMMQYVTQEGVQGICPDGWHIPTDGEWTILTDFLGGEVVAGGKMKETGYAHWNEPNIGASNTSGFTALPGGFRYNSGNFDYMELTGYFWSSSESGATTAWRRALFYINEHVFRFSSSKASGYSVRCLKD